MLRRSSETAVQVSPTSVEVASRRALAKAIVAHGHHPAAGLIDPEQAPATPIPLHPGAARYYREREITQ